MFKKAGFKYVYELEGGFLNWKKESLKSISK
jgi:rhodanese-related sulfurtransferase